MQIYFHSRLWSYLPRVPILVEGTVYIYIFFFYIYIFFVRYTIIQSITSSEMCSLHLTHPSAYTFQAVGTVHSAVDTQEILQHGHRM